MYMKGEAKLSLLKVFDQSKKNTQLKVLKFKIYLCSEKKPGEQVLTFVKQSLYFKKLTMYPLFTCMYILCGLKTYIKL